jgi:predicted nucleic acid-binding protein
MAIRPLRDVPVNSSIFVDTNILVYHLLEDELYGANCRDFLKRVETGSIVAFTSPIVASETLFIYLRAWVIQNKKIAALIERHRLPALATRDDDFDNVDGLDVYKP